MKLSNFLQDDMPVSKGSIKIPIKGLIESYRDKYFEATTVKHLSCKHTIYKVNDDTIIHVKVPSETVDNFYYDVLLELRYSPSVMHIEDCDIKIFSNSPSFVYSYAYVFYHLNLDEEPTKNTRNKTGMMISSMTRKIPKGRLLISGTEDKLNDEALKYPPVTRNSLGLPLFDKSIYFAVFYLQANVTMAQIRGTRRTTTMSSLLNNVSDFDTLMQNRKIIAARQRRAKTARDKAIHKAVKKSGLGVKKTAPSIRSIKPIKASTATKPISAKKPTRMRRPKSK